jgi:hypothetical protein
MPAASSSSGGRSKQQGQTAPELEIELGLKGKKGARVLTERDAKLGEARGGRDGVDRRRAEGGIRSGKTTNAAAWGRPSSSWWLRRTETRAGKTLDSSERRGRRSGYAGEQQTAMAASAMAGEVESERGKGGKDLGGG